VISLTDRAKQYLLNACINEKKPGVKLEVKGGGCAGFSYDYNFIDQQSRDPLDFIVNLDDQHTFVVDGMSLLYLAGTELDYEQRLGSSSLVFKNPNETSSCGCGKSFSVG
jgi:iron-sulfur cluster assembly protein